MVSPPFTSNFFTTASGTKTHYLRSGEQNEALVICLHGLGGSVNTCLAAAKTIIKEAKIATTENEPNFWVYQAFTVAASIIFILDMLHRHPSEAEYSEHKQYAEEALAILQQLHGSMIATRGVKLLSALLEEISLVTQSFNSRKRGRDDQQTGDSSKARQTFNVLAFVKTFSSGRKRSQRPAAANNNYEDEPAEMNSHATKQDSVFMVQESRPMIPSPFDSFAGHDTDINLAFYGQGLENSTPFENLLYLANHDLGFFWSISKQDTLFMNDEDWGVHGKRYQFRERLENITNLYQYESF